MRTVVRGAPCCPLSCMTVGQNRVMGVRQLTVQLAVDVLVGMSFIEKGRDIDVHCGLLSISALAPSMPGVSLVP